MTLKSWSQNHWLVAHEPAGEEIADLLSVVDRDLKDAGVKGLSPDTRMALAYNAGLQLATLALAAAGYRPGRDRPHERAIHSLRFTAGPDVALIDALELARRKRNTSNYDRAGAVSQSEAVEMRKAVL
jgi:hypothetical protein